MPPVMERACSIPKDAAELWMAAVTTRPVSMPRAGFLKAVKRLTKAGESASGATEPLIRTIPYIRMAKPSRPLPSSFLLVFLASMIRMIPINARSGEKDSGFSILTKTLSLDTPIKLMIQAVTVVPILDPMMTPTVLPIFISPEFTRPTSMTVTAEEL